LAVSENCRDGDRSGVEFLPVAHAVSPRPGLLRTKACSPCESICRAYGRGWDHAVMRNAYVTGAMRAAAKRPVGIFPPELLGARQNPAQIRRRVNRGLAACHGYGSLVQACGTNLPASCAHLLFRTPSL